MHDATSFPISQASIKATETQSLLQQKLKTEYHKTWYVQSWQAPQFDKMDVLLWRYIYHTHPHGT